MKPFTRKAQVRILRVTAELIEGMPNAKYLMLAMLRKLPDDAIIVRSNYDDGVPHFLAEDDTPNVPATYRYKVYSATYDVVPAGQPAPEVHFFIQAEDIAAEMRGGAASPLTKPVPTVSAIPVRCACDFAYTGLKQHKWTCPAR